MVAVLAKHGERPAAELDRQATREPAVPAVAEQPEEPWPLRWTRKEYYRLAEAGLLDAHPHVQLIEGEIVEMSPQDSPHATAISKAGSALQRAFGEGFYPRLQLPLALGGRSDPEPDVAVVPGEPDDYADEHPHAALLVVEVSDKTLRYDRTHKASLYASFGLREYWILDLVHRRLEVRREPEPMADEPFGYGYGLTNTYGPTDVVRCLAAPDQPVAVADLLPRPRAQAAADAKPKPRGGRKPARKESR